MLANNQVAQQRDEQHRGERITLRDMEVQRQSGDGQTGKRTCRPMDDTYPRRAVAVLGYKKHRHQDPVRLGKVQGTSHQARGR